MTIIDRRESVAEGTAVKAPCRVATTANIALTGLQTIDGIVLAEGDRVLVKNQATGADNGIYSASTGNWTRTKDFDGAYDIVTGTRVFVTAGTANANTEWSVSTTGAITVDTTSIAFQVITALGTPFADGTVAAPGAAFASAPSWGFYKTASGVGVAIAGVKVFEFLSSLFIQTAHIAANAVTLAKLVNASAQYKILGRKTAASGNWEECSLSDVLDFVTSAARGDILVRGATTWGRSAVGSSGRVLASDGTDPAWAYADGPILHVRNEQTSGTAAGETLTATTWNKRVLNTVKTNEITGASLATSQITLPAGTYFVDARLQSGLSNNCKLRSRLRNVTDSADLVIGMSAYGGVVGGGGTYNDMKETDLRGRFTLSGTTAIELQYWSDGLLAPTASTAGVVEVYADVLIRRVG